MLYKSLPNANPNVHVCAAGKVETMKCYFNENQNKQMNFLLLKKCGKFKLNLFYIVQYS
jgi:hypothetical protein